MKKRLFIMMAILAVVLPGCLVKSLHPFYSDESVVFRSELCGTWKDGDGGSWEIARHNRRKGLFNSEPDKAYDVIFSDNKGTSRFIAHLFTVSRQLYLDFYPEEVNAGNDLGGMHLVPAHTLAQVALQGNTIRIRWYNEEWLVSQFRRNRIRIAHERIPCETDDNSPDNFQVVLTAPSPELQKFVEKYGNDPEAFSKEADQRGYTFVLTRTSSN